MKGVEKHLLISLFILVGIVFFVLDDQPAQAGGSSPVAVAQENSQAPVFQNAVSTPYVPLSVEGKFEYLEITESCTHDGRGLCIPAFSGPGIEYEEIYELEKGMMLKIKNRVQVDGQTWYVVHFDEWVRYPERTYKEWYIPAVAGRVVKGNGLETLQGKVTTNKHIIVDLSDHMLYAYDGDVEFMRTKVSTGQEFTPTPQGSFTIYKKTPTRYMQGPLPGVTDVPFDLPGVPWNMYFTQGGAVIHGSYWHDRYGTEQSSGCINLPPELSKILYEWAPVGITVVIQD